MGETELRGFEDPVKVWELRGQDDNETLCLGGRWSTTELINEHDRLPNAADLLSADVETCFPSKALS